MENNNQRADVTRMTDSEIKKALKCHMTDENYTCGSCAYKDCGCSYALCRDTLDLINRRDAKIESLTKEIMDMAITIETCKTEGVNEFCNGLIAEILQKPEGKTPDGAYYNNGRNDREKEIIEIIERRRGEKLEETPSYQKQQKPYKVITLCGSTKFKDAFYEVQKRLTLEGCIVISVGLFGHSGDDEALNDETKAMLDDMHKRKIDMADEIFVIDVDGYIGSSTRSEIEYAKKHNKPISYLSECK